MAKNISEHPLATMHVSKHDFVERYQTVRRFTEQLCEPLVAEDYVIQSMPDVSPTKWHLAHVTWFWETFLLSPALPGYTSFIQSMRTSLTPITIRLANGMLGQCEV